MSHTRKLIILVTSSGYSDRHLIEPRAYLPIRVVIIRVRFKLIDIAMVLSDEVTGLLKILLGFSREARRSSKSLSEALRSRAFSKHQR